MYRLTKHRSAELALREAEGRTPAALPEQDFRVAVRGLPRYEPVNVLAQVDRVLRRGVSVEELRDRFDTRTDKPPCGARARRWLYASMRDALSGRSREEARARVRELMLVWVTEW